jgi:hypothetical protein
VELSPSPEGGAEVVTVETVPNASSGEVSSVVRWRVRGVTGEVDPGAFLVFRDELSDYHLRRITSGEVLPSTLLARQVPTVNWRDADGVVVAPSAVLAAGQRYSLVWRARGLLAAFATQSSPTPLLKRVWPPLGEESAAAVAVYCGEVEAFVSYRVQLEPLGQRAVIEPAQRVGCIRVRVLEALLRDTTLLPPHHVNGVALEPTPLTHRPVAPVPPLPCAAPDVQIGPGCALAMDDRALVRMPPLRVLAEVAEPAQAQLFDVPRGGVLVLRGLLPARSQLVRLMLTDAAGGVSDADATVQTTAARPHVVLNEVLADPSGAEPAQEWVELFNDGASAVDTGTLTLSDSGTTVTLPSSVLAPGAYALVTARGFELGAIGDVAPVAGVPILRVEALGKGGLANSGEALTLRAAGEVVSRAPAQPKPRPGVSVARRSPELPDDALSFGLHAEPGASPGAPNQVR